MNELTKNLTRLSLYGLSCRLLNLGDEDPSKGRVLQAARDLIEQGPTIGWGEEYGPWYLKQLSDIPLYIVGRPIAEPNDTITFWKTRTQTHVLKPAEAGKGELVANLWRIAYYRTLRGKDREFVALDLGYEVQWQPYYKGQFVCSNCGADADPAIIATSTYCNCSSKSVT